MAIKFHSCSPSLAEDPKNHKLNARIRKGPAGFYPPSGRLVITLWNRRFIPEGLHCGQTPLIPQTYDITLLTLMKGNSNIRPLLRLSGWNDLRASGGLTNPGGGGRHFL